MNKKLLILLLSLAVFGSCSKNRNSFTLEELKKLKHMNTDEYDTYVLSKGYELERSNVGDNGANRIYSINNQGPDNSSIIFVESGDYKSIHYFTADKELYSRFKIDAESLNFQFTGSGPTPGRTGSSLFYVGPEKDSLTLVTVPPSKDIGNEMTMYNIEFK